MLTITSDNFNSEVTSSDKPVLLDFWAPWCGPCRALAPVMDEVKAESTGVKIGKINVDEQPELTQKFGIMSIPTLVYIRGGEIAGQLIGFNAKEDILKLIAPAE